MSANSAPGILADVNLWLATIVESHPHHQRAIAWWREGVIGTDCTVYLCRETQLGLLRLLTNSRVMGAGVCAAGPAWELVDAVRSQGPVGYLVEPVALEPILRELTATQPGSPGLWTDAYLAAFARTAGTRLTTFDRGFRRFAGLDLELLS